MAEAQIPETPAAADTTKATGPKTKPAPKSLDALTRAALKSMTKQLKQEYTNETKVALVLCVKSSVGAALETVMRQFLQAVLSKIVSIVLSANRRTITDNNVSFVLNMMEHLDAGLKEKFRQESAVQISTESAISAKRNARRQGHLAVFQEFTRTKVAIPVEELPTVSACMAALEKVFPALEGTTKQVRRVNMYTLLEQISTAVPEMRPAAITARNKLNDVNVNAVHPSEEVPQSKRNLHKLHFNPSLVHRHVQAILATLSLNADASSITEQSPTKRARAPQGTSLNQSATLKLTISRLLDVFMRRIVEDMFNEALRNRDTAVNTSAMDSDGDEMDSDENDQDNDGPAPNEPSGEADQAKVPSAHCHVTLEHLLIALQGFESMHPYTDFEALKHEVVKSASKRDVKQVAERYNILLPNQTPAPPSSLIE